MRGVVLLHLTMRICAGGYAAWIFDWLKCIDVAWLCTSAGACINTVVTGQATANLKHPNPENVDK